MIGNTNSCSNSKLENKKKTRMLIVLFIYKMQEMLNECETSKLKLFIPFRNKLILTCRLVALHDKEYEG